VTNGHPAIGDQIPSPTHNGNGMDGGQVDIGLNVQQQQVTTLFDCRHLMMENLRRKLFM